MSVVRSGYKISLTGEKRLSRNRNRYRNHAIVKIVERRAIDFQQKPNPILWALYIFSLYFYYTCI